MYVLVPLLIYHLFPPLSTNVEREEAANEFAALLIVDSLI